VALSCCDIMQKSAVDGFLNNNSGFETQLMKATLRFRIASS